MILEFINHVYTKLELTKHEYLEIPTVSAKSIYSVSTLIRGFAYFLSSWECDTGSWKII